MSLATRVRCLSFHADYACRNTGVCCSSGWEIAVEERVEADLSIQMQSGVRLPSGPDGFHPMRDPPQGCRSALRHKDSRGVCWFRDESDRSCALHRELGEEALPSACRQFPRICVLEPDVVSVSLSHYCPTAAATLFGNHPVLRLVEAPRAFPAAFPFEGLDCRTAFPPFLRPGVSLGFDGLRALEEGAVVAFARGDLWSSLAAIAAAVSVSRSWNPSLGPLADFIGSSFAAPQGSEPALRYPDPRPALEAAFTKGTRRDVALPDHDPGVPSISPSIDLALRRYLASRLIAGWILFLADDLGALTRYLRLCLHTVFLFASAGSDAADEKSRWREAVRNADLWILQYSDPGRLARVLR